MGEIFLKKKKYHYQKLSTVDLLIFTFVTDLSYRKFLTHLFHCKLNCLLLICNYLPIVIVTTNTR